MMKYLLIVTFILICSSQFFSQGYIGLGSGVNFFKTSSTLEGLIHTSVEIEKNSPRLSGQIYYQHKFHDLYSQELRIAYRDNSFKQVKISGDYSGSYDTSKITIKCLDIINFHEIKLHEKTPLYFKFGVNLTRMLAVDKESKGHYYDYGPGLLVNDSTNNVYSWNYNSTYKPKTWEFGFSVGLLYSIAINKNLNLRLETLYYHQLKSNYNVENIYSKAFQFNVGLSYNLKIRKINSSE